MFETPLTYVDMCLFDPFTKAYIEITFAVISDVIDTVCQMRDPSSGVATGVARRAECHP